MSLVGALAIEGNKSNWPLMPMRAFLSQKNSTGGIDLPLLGVSLDSGVRSRTDSDGRPAPSEDLGNYKIVEAGDVVMNRLGKPHGSVGVSLQRGITSPAYWVLEVNRSLADPAFVHHLLRSYHLVSEYGRLGKFMPPNQFDISWDSFRDICVPLPPVGHQRRIADFLDLEIGRIGRIIELRRRQYETVGERLHEFMRAGVMGRILGGDEKDTGVPWIGLANSAVEVVPLGRILHLQRGLDLTDAERVEGIVSVITTAGVVGVHNVIVENGPGVVVGRYGSAGSVHWIDGPYWPHNTTLYVKNFRGNDPRYCYYLLKIFPFDMEQVKSAIPGINRNDLHKRLMPKLPVDLQRIIVGELDRAFAIAERLRKGTLRSIRLLEERRQALITAAVTGQIDVTTARGVDV